MGFRDGSGPKIRDFQNTDYTVTTQYPASVTVPGTTATAAVSDASFTAHTNATVRTWTQYLIAAGLQYAVRYASSNPAVATVDPIYGTVTPVSDGTTIITVVPFNLQFSCTVTTTAGSTHNTFTQFNAGSLGRHLTDTLSALLTGITPPTIPSNPALMPAAWDTHYNEYAASWGGDRNPGFWLNGVAGLTGRGGVNGWGCTLISKRDVLVATHVFGSVSPAGTGVQSAVGSFTTFYPGLWSDRMAVPNSNMTSIANTDINVVTLAQDVPDGITPLRLLPANFRTRLPQPQYGYPVVVRTQDNVTGVRDSAAFPSLYGEVYCPPSVDSLRALWSPTIRGGDSSSPVGMVLTADLGVRELVAFSQLHTAVCSGPIFSDLLTQINAAMARNGSPYQIRTGARTLPGDGQTVDLSGFTAF